MLIDCSRLLNSARAIRVTTFRLGLEQHTHCRRYNARSTKLRHASTSTATVSEGTIDGSHIDVNKYDHLNPQPPDYSSTPFIDSCNLTIASGAGGHGCASFLREKYVAHGPPNGGDGGTGGNVYIQAVKGETSLHKIARRRLLRAGRGKNGQGALQGGKRGDDVLITVPIGTVIRETSRIDPVSEELKETWQRNENADEETSSTAEDWKKHWLLYPGTLPETFTAGHIPKAPRPRQSGLAMVAAAAPIRLDLDKPMATPLLLAAGAMGGLGNPHFVTKTVMRPKYATRGHTGITIDLQLELKLLADIGLVGLPNAGKSTLLRALTASRARVGNWAFTTLAPNVGTVVLDASGPAAQVRQLRDAYTGDFRTHFTIADIPGLIEGAHLDKGLGLDFLRHIERARALAFVIDLSAGDAVTALKSLWSELREYEMMRGEAEVPAEAYDPNPWDSTPVKLPKLKLASISSKPWLVVATKADLPQTQDNFNTLQEYLARVTAGKEPHPSGKPNAWIFNVVTVPVCAKDKQNTEPVLDHLVELLGQP